MKQRTDSNLYEDFDNPDHCFELLETVTNTLKSTVDLAEEVLFFLLAL